MTSTDFRAVFFPYCLRKQGDGRFIVLNRAYKPVGLFADVPVAYSDLPVSVELIGLTSAKAAKLSDAGDPSVDEIYLYSDQTNPVSSESNMRAYLAKLSILARLSVA